MNKIYNFIIFVLALFFFLIIPNKEVRAGDEACTDPGYPVCMSTRIINEYSCTTLTTSRKFCGILGQDTPASYTVCNPGDAYPCLGILVGNVQTTCNTYYCLSGSPDCYTSPRYSCGSTGTVTVGCQTSTGFCRFIYNNYKECSIQSYRSMFRNFVR